MLAVEDVSRSCPVTMSVRWLKQASRDDAKERAAQQAGDGKTTEPAAAETWWRLAVHPMADVEHLQRLIKQGQLERVQLIKKGVGADNTRSKAEMELRVNRLTGRQGSIAALVEQWAQRKFQDDPGEEGDQGVPVITDADAAKALAAVLGQDIAELGFDDCYVMINDDGKSKPISPSRLSDYFIYHIARDRQPTPLAFYEQARDTAQRVTRSGELAGLQWPPITW